MAEILTAAEDEELHYAARATNVQFEALGHLLRPEEIKAVPASIINGAQFRLANNYSRAETLKWLRNAWNTESVLRLQLELDEESRRFALQWAFSQAYYAGFCQVLAMFVTCGRSERSHTAVLKQFGQLIKSGKYPSQISWFSDGGMNELVMTGVSKGKYPSSLYLELSEPASVDNQVAQFLKSTREKALKEKKGDHKFKTKAGMLKRSLSAEDWGKVSNALGPTTVLNILRRKRIKANYREIDTFLRTEISGEKVLGGLIRVAQALALIHESILGLVLPADEFCALKNAVPERYDFVTKRLSLVSEAIVKHDDATDRASPDR